MSQNLIILLLALAVICGAEGVFFVVGLVGHQRRADLMRRLRGATEAGREVSLLRERKLSRSPALARLLEGVGPARRLERLLLQTDLPLTVASLLALGGALALGVTIGALLLAPGRPLLALLGPPLGVLVPVLYLLAVRERRSRKLSQQLPEALDMMVRSLRAGHSVGAGFKLVASELPPPVAVEFARCFEEQNAGVSLRDCVTHMTERMPGNVDLRIFAVSLVVQHETGGNLVEILEQIASTVRGRFQFFGKLRTLTAEARLSGIVLACLPFVTFTILYVMRPAYLAPLFKDSLGLLTLASGAASWLIGALWMRTLAQVDY